jgi:dTDP-4-dehydrorhamnose reductase
MWLILGGNGQLGQSLQFVLSQQRIPFKVAGRDALDISNQSACIDFIKEQQPQVVVNCAAWTAVDLAEDNEAQAFLINSDGARNVAIACREARTVLVHVSTDYVFSGIATSPYEVDHPTEPVSVYGKSKLGGEEAVTAEYAEGSYIVRTAWLYSQFGSNFVKTMIRKGQSASPVRVVADQLGQPTLATDLAQHIVDLVTHSAPFGTFHGTNSGQTSWYELTREIYSLLGVDTSLVTPVPTTEYPTKAVRPQYSVLSHSHTAVLNMPYIQDWKLALKNSLPIIVQSISEESKQ